MNDSSFLEKKIRQLIKLYQELEMSNKISMEELASQIRHIGFQCIGCGDCCRGEDNSVVVFPEEIRLISQLTSDSWLEIVEPPMIGEWDINGNFHTLEWRLKKKKLLCKYYTLQGCSIYEGRPIICRTYPFFINDGNLDFSECQGLGKEIGIEESEKLAKLLIDRLIVEIEESISLIQKYNDFERGDSSSKKDCIIHDSEGEHRISLNSLND
jgi:Fe-S-cluster containining protein